MFTIILLILFLQNLARMENIIEFEAFGGDDMTGSITDLDSNSVGVDDSNGGGWVISLG